jgi:hypothetical protein
MCSACDMETTNDPGRIQDLQRRIETLQNAIYDAYDMAGQRGKGACRSIRQRLQRFADERAKQFSENCDEAVRLANQEEEGR